MAVIAWVNSPTISSDPAFKGRNFAARLRLTTLREQERERKGEREKVGVYREIDTIDYFIPWNMT